MISWRQICVILESFELETGLGRVMRNPTIEGRSQWMRENSYLRFIEIPSQFSCATCGDVGERARRSFMYILQLHFVLIT